MDIFNKYLNVQNTATLSREMYTPVKKICDKMTKGIAKF